LCAALILAFAILRIKCEEVMVAARYPEYVQYAATTWRLIPYVF
jgi:protein-S-isoprenylcysteine O-methyltransferase Ste14